MPCEAAANRHAGRYEAMRSDREATARGRRGRTALMSMSTTVRRIVLAGLVLLLTGGAAAGQTTQPAPASAPSPASGPAPTLPAFQAPDDVEPAAEWPVVVRKFAETLVSPAGTMVNSAALRPVVMK